MKFKKFIFLLLIVVFSLTLFGCDISGGSDGGADKNSGQNEADSGNGNSGSGNTDSGNYGNGNSGNGSTNNGYSDSDYTESDDNNGNSGSPVKLTWSAGTDSTVHIVDFGTVPDSATVSFNFGYDTISLKNKGYTTLNFELTFTARIDSGAWPSSDIDIYFKNNNNAQFGVGWSGLHFTNDSGKTFTYNKSINISNLQQNKGNLYLTFDVVSNTFLTGTYFSGIQLTVTAE